MNLRRTIIDALALLVFVAGAAAIANAQQRTFMSTTGNDANNCTSTATPCRTAQAAHNKVVSGGEVVAITSGGFGPIVISKSMSIIGTGYGATLTALPGGDAVRILTPGLHVALRDLRIQGWGTGDDGIEVSDPAPPALNGPQVKLVNGAGPGSLHIHGCTIEKFTGHGIEYNSSGRLVISHTISRENQGSGIKVNASGRLIPTIQSNVANGINGFGTAYITIDHSYFMRNSYDGINFNSGTVKATISDTVMSENNDDGIDVHSSAYTEVNCIRCTAGNNGGDGFVVFYSNVACATNGQTVPRLGAEYCKAHNNGDSGFKNDGGAMGVAYSASGGNIVGFNNVGGSFISMGNNFVSGNDTETVGSITVGGSE